MMKLLRFLKPYRVPVVLVLILTFLQTLSNLYLPTLMSDIVDVGIVQGDVPYILKIGAFMLAIAALSVVFSILASFYSAKAALGYSRDLRSSVFNHVENFSLHGFDKIGTSSLITRTTNDITQVQRVTAMMLRMMVMAPMMCIGGIIMAVSKDAKLSLVIVAAIPVLAIAIIIVQKKAIPLFKAMQKKLDKLNLILREGLSGVRVIRSFNRIDHEKERFKESNTELTNTAIKVNKIIAALMPIMMIVLNFSTIAILWFGSIRIDHGHMQVGDLMAFIQYAMQIMFSLMMVSMMFVMIPRASVSASRINEVLELEPDILDPDRVITANEQKGHVAFQNVTFSFQGAEKPAVSDISFSAEPGEVTAVIGGTGSGKSTMINLIPRFYDVDSGSVLVDGTDVRDMAQGDLRAKIGFVPQKAVLFKGTVAENIRFGNETAMDEEVFQAAEIAQAAEFVSNLENGFETVIEEGGANLSGGQKQRLSIARALVRRPEIYVFDDSFSALDFKTDAKLRARLKQEISDSTVIIVAQRVSTVMDADRIIVLEEGKIAGIGMHQELMKTCDVYKEIVSSQLSEEEIA
ncbi:ATP-binding cassette subfamily B protein [Scopulibacillus darangshiensis]|uniref:ATP-binding cassette subfamily B protein n=1 Tax=Scopulibacillus darangshiensis TaxID=442528 RepID=A0A4R2NG32_9BACL|nr:ABC transporter ATP-binding protein [Scopulibacillus darangshiensis]TCP20349.1 ATP-binding cassette subfamily B protein [Scopulibacillus darangshiensis]